MMSKKPKFVDPEQEIREIFNVFDRDGSGTINSSELRHVMKAIGENLTDAEIDDLIKEADVDGNGTIDCEFMSSILLPLHSCLVRVDVLWNFASGPETDACVCRRGVRKVFQEGLEKAWEKKRWISLRKRIPVDWVVFFSPFGRVSYHVERS